MEVNFTKLRVMWMLGFLLVFFFLGGFQAPTLSDDSLLSPSRVLKAWLLCIVFFLGGAFTTSFTDHYVGTLDRSNIRLVYVIFGVLSMAASLFYLLNLKIAAEG